GVLGALPPRHLGLGDLRRDVDLHQEDFHTRQVTRPGEGAKLRRGSAKGYRIKEDTWMLEYGRGFVPTALPIGLGDAVVSAQDVRIVSKTVRNYGKLVVRSLLQGK